MVVDIKHKDTKLIPPTPPPLIGQFSPECDSTWVFCP